MIVKTKTRYIIPFHFGSPEQSKRDFIRFLDMKRDPYKGSWKEDSVRSGEQDLHEYVLNSIDDAGAYAPGNIGTSFSYISGTEEGSRVLPLKYCGTSLSGNEEKFIFDIEKAGMLLFVSGTGFFWYEISFPVSEDGKAMSEDDYVVFNYRFKELNYGENTGRFMVRGSGEKFTMGSWAAEILEAACGKVGFFSKRKNTLSGQDKPEFVPDKALIFNYSVYDEGSPKESIISDAYHLSKGYDQKYKPPLDVEEKMFHPFENITWFADSEGAGFYALSCKDDKQFFMDTMEKRFMRDYFLIYILTLNVEYSIISYSREISTLLPADPVAYFSEDLYVDVSGIDGDDDIRKLDLEKTIRRLVTELNVFIVKNLRPSVSYIGHQNEFYRYLCDRLNIREETAMVKDGLSSIQRLLNESINIDNGLSDEEVNAWRKEQDYKKLREEKEILQRELYTDPLTGLYNRKAMTVYSRKMYSEAKQTGKALFISVSDMSGLKYINDNFGHENGDRAIRENAEIIKESMTEGDLAFRTGGDEFLIMGFRETTEGVAEDFSRRMEAIIEKRNADLDLPYRVDLSFGPLVVKVDGTEGGLDKLIKDSDTLMYEMKKSRDLHIR